MMEKGLVNPNWLVTTRITPSFPWNNFSSYIEKTHDFCIEQQTIPSLLTSNLCQSQVHNP